METDKKKKQREYMRKYRLENKDKCRDKDKIYRSSAKAKETRRLWRLSAQGKEVWKKWEKSDKRKEWLKQYRNTPQQKLKAKERNKRYHASERYKTRKYIYRKSKINKELRNKRDKIRRQTDIKFRINSNISSNISQVLKNQKKGRRWEILVGYTVYDLIQHLEKQFDDKMNWDNYGNNWAGYSWHIDHIKPKSLFHYETPEDEEFKQCWALSNLRPLEKKENIKKSNKYINMDA